MNRTVSDGRRERSESTRRRILDAARSLILAGSFDPTTEAIATHAGITRRTLFRHFPDMKTLHRAIILDAQEYAQAVMEEPFPTALQHNHQRNEKTVDTWLPRLELVIERRVRMYEYLLPLYISAVYQRSRSTKSDESQRNYAHRRRRRLKEILPATLSSNTLLLESLDAILSIDYWIALRHDQQLTVAKATKVLRYAVTQLTHWAD